MGAFFVTLAPEEAGDDVTLAEYREAFLTSPVFMAELAVLRWAGAANEENTSAERLSKVARGESTAFAAWVEVARTGSPIGAPEAGGEGSGDGDGDGDGLLAALATSGPADVVMKADGVNTWWGVDRVDGGRTRLWFGSA